MTSRLLSAIDDVSFDTYSQHVGLQGVISDDIILSSFSRCVAGAWMRNVASEIAPYLIFRHINTLYNAYLISTVVRSGLLLYCDGGVLVQI